MHKNTQQNKQQINSGHEPFSSHWRTSNGWFSHLLMTIEKLAKLTAAQKARLSHMGRGCKNGKTG